MNGVHMPSEFTAREKALEADREVAMRKRVYVSMTPLQKRRIAIMEEIAEEYRRLIKADDLFERKNANA